MSTIKVNKIENTSTTNGGISIDNSGHVTVDGQQLPSAGPLSNRNLVVNGAMQVAQRAAQVTGKTTSGYYTCDRVRFALSDLGTWTLDQAADGPPGFTKSFKATCTTADASPAAADIAYVQYRMEGQDLQHLKFGTSDAVAMTLSFWVKSNKTGSASFMMFQNDNSNKLFSTSYTISSADTWEYKTIAIPADTSGLINDDNGIGLTMAFWLNSGSDNTGGSYNTTWGTLTSANTNVNNLGVGGAVNDYFQITGVQLEVGSVATPFEHRSFGEELEICKRYFQKSYSYHIGVGANTNNGRYYWLLGVDSAARNKGGSIYLGHEMRVAPTLQLYNDAGTQGVIQFPASTATPLLLKTNVIAIYVANTTAAEIAGAWTADAEL